MSPIKTKVVIFMDEVYSFVGIGRQYLSIIGHVTMFRWRRNFQDVIEESINDDY